jgi:hypothetical protein
MINLINNFLNAFERFYKRVFVALIMTCLYPVIILLFILGLLSISDDED